MSAITLALVGLSLSAVGSNVKEDGSASEEGLEVGRKLPRKERLELV